MIRINSFSVFLKYTLLLFVIIYFCFKIFNYFYTWNYCDYWSDIVQENSQEDIRETRKCVNTMICEVWNIRLSLINNDSNDKLKSFSCLRKFESWVWKW